MWHLRKNAPQPKDPPKTGNLHPKPPLGPANNLQKMQRTEEHVQHPHEYVISKIHSVDFRSQYLISKDKKGL